MRVRNTTSITLIELIVAMVLFTTMALGFYSIDIFSRNHVLVSKRRALLQDELSRILLHMSKYVQTGIGFLNDPPLQCYPNKLDCSNPTGFGVRVDCSDNHTPDNYGDDTLVVYTLTGNTLSALCRNHDNTGDCPSTFGGGETCIPLTEVLSTHIVHISGNPGVVYGTLPASPADGFYYQFSESNSIVEVGLVARWDPSSAESADNPQVTMKVILYAHSASAR